MAKEESKMLHLTSKTWDEGVLKSDLPVLVDFSAKWCGPCKTIAPFVAQIAEERAGKVKIGKLDIDKDKDIAWKYNIQGVPTLLVFVKGKVVGQAVGSMAKQYIDEFVDAAIEGQRPGLPKKRKG